MTDYPPTLARGDYVYTYDECKCLITDYRDSETLVCTRIDDGREVYLKSTQVSRQPPPKKAYPYMPRSQMSKEQEAELQKRLTILLPLVKQRNRTELEQAAAALDLSASRVYSMIHKFRETNDPRAFAGPCPTGGRGISRMQEREAELNLVIRLKVLKRNRKKPKVKLIQVYRVLRWRCERAKPPLKTPAYNTLASRLRALTTQRKAELLNRYKPSRKRHLIAPGEFPEATYPLQCILIDNFRIDLVIVDQKYRINMGRPWLTLAIDAFTRMVVGYYLSRDDPSTLSVGLCLVTIIHKKDKILERLGINAKWSSFGMPVLIHTDNGRDFVSEPFRNACRGRGIELVNRPLRNPEMGGIVERWGGFFNGEFWEFPGATFNNPEVRGDYDAESDGSITLDELERIAVRLIIRYHHDIHSSIKCTPEAKWDAGIIGDSDTPGIGIPEIPSDIDNLYYEILPMTTRLIGKRGIVWDNLRYSCDRLYDLLLERDPEDPQKMMNFVIKRDPRSLKQIFLQLPRSDNFIIVPWAHKDRRDVNLWDYRTAKAEAERRGLETRDEEVVLRMNEEIQEQLEISQRLTKHQRRARDRNQRNTELPNPTKSTDMSIASSPKAEPPRPLPQLDSSPSPYDEVKIL